MTVTARAPAKINLHLSVGPVRADGFHDLATLYQAVDLGDEVTASATRGADITVRVDGAAGVPLDDTNLAVRAALLLREHADLPVAGVDLVLRKQIPVAGGMAGGSADAAAALLACDALWGCGLSHPDLVALGARLGSDVPFALVGGTAVGTGRGEAVTPVTPGPDLVWVAATSARGLSTPEVYAALDRTRDDTPVPAPVVPDGLVTALEGDRAGLLTALSGFARNDLQAPALALRPELADVLTVGREAGALYSTVSGSGPTTLFLADPDHAERLAGVLAAAPEVDGVHVLTGPVPGATLVP